MSGDDALGEADMADDAGLPATPRFAVVLRGYDRRQVDEHVERLQRVFARMRADLDAARSDAPPAVGPSPRPAPRPRPGTPEGDQIGSFTDRMQSILAEAEAEAAEIRGAAQRAARAETDGVRAQLADLVRQRDNVYAELTRMRAQLEGMLAAPTASMPARYGPDRRPSGPPPGHGPEPARPGAMAPHGPPFGPAGPVPPGPVRPGPASGPVQLRPDGPRGADGAPPAAGPPGGPVPRAAGPDEPPGTAPRPAEQRPVPSGSHVDPDALDARAARTARRAAANDEAAGPDADGTAGPDRERRGPEGAPADAGARPTGPAPGMNGSGGAPGAPTAARPAGAPAGSGPPPAAAGAQAGGGPDRPDGGSGGSAADASARRDQGRPAHRLPTGAYPAVTAEPPERAGPAAPDGDDLFRPPGGRGTPPAGARPADSRPADPRPADPRPADPRPAESSRAAAQQPERSGPDGGTRGGDATVLAPVPGRSSARADDA